MVDSIGTSANHPLPVKQGSAQRSLSDEQKSLLEETLSSYDADNLSEQDANAIVSALSEAGIQPGKGLGDAMSELGFDAREIGDLAGVERPGNRPPPPPRQSEEELNSMVSYMTDLVTEKLSSSETGELNEADRQDVHKQMIEKFSLNSDEPIIHTTA